MQGAGIGGEGGNMDRDNLIIPSFFTTNGADIWELESYALEPSCELVNIKTGEKKSFAMGGLMAESFKRIKMPN